MIPGATKTAAKPKIKVTKMTKQQLAEMAAKAMTLLMDLHACDENDTWSHRQTDEFHTLASMLPEYLQDGYWENASISAKELA